MKILLFLMVNGKEYIAEIHYEERVSYFNTEVKFHLRQIDTHKIILAQCYS